MSAIATRTILAVPRLAGVQGLRFDVPLAARRALATVMLAAAVVSSFGAAAAAEERTLLRAATADRTSIVLVFACQPGNPGNCRSSTAFSVAAGVYVTAYHALLGAGRVTLSSALHGTAAAQVARVDWDDDLVVLQSPLRLPALTTAAPVAGEGAAVVCSRRAITRDGLIGRPATYVGQVGGAPIRVDDSGRPVLLERVAGAASVLGCSGSPVVDRAGAVTGVLLAGDGASAGMVDARRLVALVSAG